MDENEKESLPRRFALKSNYNNSYLRFVPDLGKIHGYLQFSGKKVASPYTKFEVQNSKTGKGLIHIRCTYNNKYWVRPSSSSTHIVAAAKEPDEDQSKYSCTLFKPYYDPGRKAFRFRHVQLDRYLHLDWLTEGTFQGCIVAKTSETERDQSDLSTVVNWDTLFVLPRYVAFKGNNGHYLRPTHLSNDVVYLQFSGTHMDEPGVKNEVIPTPDGHVRMKNLPYGKFWVLNPSWIHVAADESQADDPKTWFWPVRLDNNNFVALRNKANNNFCKRLTLDRKENTLNAGTDTITDEARLEITEVVLSREIYNVRFRLPDCRIYNEKPLMVTSGIVENRNTVDDKVTVKLSYEDTTTSTWSSSVSVKVAAKLTISTGVPKLSEGEVEVSAEFSGECLWGGTQQTKSTVEVVHEIVVVSGTKVKASIIATQGTCDVPFSYTQRDTLTNGRVISRRYDDGVYTGVNSYNYQFVTEEVNE